VIIIDSWTGRERCLVGKIRVSTVFLHLDHSWGDGPPVLFETMVFGDDTEDERQERYFTWDQAMKGHQAIVDELSAHYPEKIIITLTR